MPASSVIPATVQDDQASFVEGNSTVLGRGFAALTKPLTDRVADALPDGAVVTALAAADRAAKAAPATDMDHDTSDLAACHEAAVRLGRIAAVTNAATGGIAGIGGAATMLVDLPASMTIAMRAIQQIGAAYGYDSDHMGEDRFRLAILELAATSDPEARRDRIDAINDAVDESGSLKIADGGEQSILEVGVERVARTVALTLARHQIGSGLPVAGAGIGAAVNASFQTDIASAARFAFQHRRIRASEGVA